MGKAERNPRAQCTRLFNETLTPLRKMKRSRWVGGGGSSHSHANQNSTSCSLARWIRRRCAQCTVEKKATKGRRPRTNTINTAQGSLTHSTYPTKAQFMSAQQPYPKIGLPTDSLSCGRLELLPSAHGKLMIRQ